MFASVLQASFALCSLAAFLAGQFWLGLPLLSLAAVCGMNADDDDGDEGDGE